MNRPGVEDLKAHAPTWPTRSIAGMKTRCTRAWAHPSGDDALAVPGHHDVRAIVGDGECYSLYFLSSSASHSASRTLPSTAFPPAPPFRSVAIAAANMPSRTPNRATSSTLLIPNQHATSDTCVMDEMLSFHGDARVDYVGKGVLVLTSSLALPRRHFPSRRAAGGRIWMHGDRGPRARGGPCAGGFKPGWHILCVCRRASSGQKRPSACGTSNWNCGPVRACADMFAEGRPARTELHRMTSDSRCSIAFTGGGRDSLCVHCGLVAPEAPILQPAPSLYRASSCTPSSTVGAR
ncbi:hypothetical protein MVEN_00069200 [Mycena venus]|uniref:Uncharacterized protein n=1 Tax=Mycena venus TaxID=2733690 RepID=A0A8H6Z3V4_9AGAR|nr:hypothetical protein MVEN_00069200 [Mycena venus]